MSLLGKLFVSLGLDDSTFRVGMQDAEKIGAKTGDALDKAAEQSRKSAEALSNLGYVAKKFAADQEKAEATLKKSQQTFQELQEAYKQGAVNADVLARAATSL